MNKIIHLLCFDIMGRDKNTDELVRVGELTLKEWDEDVLDNKFYETIESLGEQEVFKYATLYVVERVTRIPLSIAFIDYNKEISPLDDEDYIDFMKSIGITLTEDDVDFMDYVYVDCVESVELDIYCTLANLDFDEIDELIMEFYRIQRERKEKQDES